MFVLTLYFRYPWGQEALDKAKAENKVIFLSGESFQYNCTCVSLTT